jgi:hypothetical protein
MGIASTWPVTVAMSKTDVWNGTELPAGITLLAAAWLRVVAVAVLAGWTVDGSEGLVELV